MAKKTSTIVLLTACLSGALAFAEDLSSEQAERALRRTLTAPTVAYEGTLTVTHWYGNQTRSEDVHVKFRPPTSYRWEYLRPDGSVRRVVVSDGQNEVVHFVDHDKKLKGGATKHAPRQMPAEQEWALLRKNYRIIGNKGESIAGRATWTVRVNPLTEGKLRQELAVDNETGVVLENKRYRPHGNYVVHSRFQRFFVTSAFPDGTFVITATNAPMEDHQFAPDFFSRESWSQTTGRTTTLPDALPHGFVLESADYFLVDGKAVDHFRYTDGLCTVSVFQTKNHLKTDPRRRVSEEGNVLPYNKGNRYYMLIGDASADVLKEMAHAFP